MSALPPDTQPQRSQITGRRAASRVRLSLPARVVLLQGQEKCMLEDLSQTGARITLTDAMPRPGASALLMIESSEFFGTVIWVSDKRCGLEFEETVPLEQVVAIRHFADAFAEHERMISRTNARHFVQGRFPQRR